MPNHTLEQSTASLVAQLTRPGAAAPTWPGIQLAAREYLIGLGVKEPAAAVVEILAESVGNALLPAADIKRTRIATVQGRHAAIAIESASIDGREMPGLAFAIASDDPAAPAAAMQISLDNAKYLVDALNDYLAKRADLSL